jgi:hypothetical protein
MDIFATGKKRLEILISKKKAGETSFTDNVQGMHQADYRRRQKSY